MWELYIGAKHAYVGSMRRCGLRTVQAEDTEEAPKTTGDEERTYLSFTKREVGGVGVPHIQAAQNNSDSHASKENLFPTRLSIITIPCFLSYIGKNALETGACRPLYSLPSQATSSPTSSTIQRTEQKTQERVLYSGAMMSAYSSAISITV